MAILTGGVGLEAEIVVQGVSRKEYAGPVNPDEDTTVSVTKYIEAEEGVNYAVRFRTTRQYEHDDYDLCWRLRIDGKIMRESLQWKEDHRKESWQTVDSITTGSKGNFMARKFLFSALATNDNAITNTDKKLKAMIKNLGQISIEIHRVTISEQLDPTHHAAPKSNIDTVPEKALKGRSLSRKTELGPAAAVAAPKTWATTWDDPKDDPIAIFTFHYRSMNDLRAEMIVPRSESPVPLEERPLDELSPEEMRELLKRQRREREEGARVKREVIRERNANSVIDLDDDEATTVPAKRRRIETIDLTGD